MTTAQTPVARHATDEGAASSAEESQPALRVEGLSKRFGNPDDSVVAVDDVSFDVASGSVVGLLGPNGAGKTTTIKSILGMVLPDAGAVEVRGIDLHAEPRRAYRHVDAMLEGARNDYWRLTVRENLRYFTTIKGVDPDSIADRHDRLLEKLGLADKADVPVRSLSRGMKQKVSLASVLASEADVVFLDEPTLGLDVESSRTLQRELQRIVAERDLTVLVSSHDMDVIENICDRVIIMNDGRIIADDTVPNLLAGGGRRTFRVTSENFDDTLIAAVRARFNVVEVTHFEERTRLDVATDSDGFYDLAAYLREHDVHLDAVNTVGADLEDVFVDLTGGRQ
jgi:ABC-2 type transport system ATP-binding protein